MTQEMHNIVILLSIFGVVAITTIIILAIFARNIRTRIQDRKRLREEQHHLEVGERFSSVVDEPYEPQLKPENMPNRVKEKL